MDFLTACWGQLNGEIQAVVSFLEPVSADGAHGAVAVDLLHQILTEVGRFAQGLWD